MSKSDQIEQLRGRLLNVEAAIGNALAQVLEKIGTDVPVAVLPANPFHPDIAEQVLALRIDEDGEAVVTTTSDTLPEKLFTSFLSDRQINHWDVIQLIEHLKLL